jgi:hypothetical protein
MVKGKRKTVATTAIARELAHLCGTSLLTLIRR